VDMGTSGAMYLLLRNFRIEAGRPMGLSGPDEHHMWVVGGPAGVERLKALFTLEPLALFPGVDAFSPVSSGPQTRDLVVRLNDAGRHLDQMPPDSWTDAACEFVVQA